MVTNSARGLTEVLAEFALTTPAASLPPAAYELARVALVDTVGVTLAGGATDTYAALAAAVDPETGHGNAIILPSGQRAAPRVAALLNATAGHALDYDDATYAAYGHPSVVLIPALLALGETMGASGRDLGTAYAIGLSCSYALAEGLDVNAHYGRGWHATGTIGVVSAAAAACRLLGATPVQTRQALGIAGSLAGGSRRNFGTMTKPLHAGTAASNAVFAATLATRGFTADQEMLERPGGYLDLFGQAEADPRRAAASVGSDPWHFLEDPPHLKLYPCCFNTHRGIEAAFEVARDEAFNTGDIAAIRVRVEPKGLAPLRSLLPATGLEGKFSMEYVVATALIDGAVTLAAFTDEAVHRADVCRLAARVYVSETDASDALRNPFADMEVDLRDGSTHRAHAELTPQRRLSLTREQVTAKFRDCVAHSGGIWDGNALEQQLWNMLDDDAAIRVRPTLTSQ